MKPSLITRSQICDAAWNLLIEQSAQSVIYGYTYYLDLVCEDWKALAWYSNGQFDIVMPLPVRRKMGKLIIYQPLFCQYLGIFSKSDLTCNQVNAFLKALSAHFSYISAYHFNPDNYKLLHQPECELRGMQFTTNNTHCLDVQVGLGKIREGYSKDRRANLKKANEACWQILRSRNIHPLIYLFVQNHAMGIAGGVNSNAYDRLEAIFEQMAYLQKAELWYAFKEGIIHAGIMVIKDARRAIYLFNAADVIGRRENARTFLLDQYFATNAQDSLVFDFESPEIHTISSFYQSFGGKSIPYLKISKNRLWPPFRQLQNLRKKLAIKTRQDPF